jgi:exonuclease III
MPRIKLGTYNVNNLFDRFDDPYSYSDDRWNPRHTKPKTLDEIYQLGERLRRDRPDIMAFQEIEGKGVLYEFNVSQLGRLFRDLALIPANDPRNIDVAVGSRFPLGQVVSYQFIRDQKTGHKLFSRDLLEVEIMDKDNPNRRLFTLFVTHLKSKYIDPSTPSSKRDEEAVQNDQRRWKQAAATAQIVRARFPNPNDFYVIMGDLNDTPDSQPLAPLLRNQQLPVYDVLRQIPDPADRWTYYWKSADQYSQIDYILLSSGLAQRIVPDSVEVVQRQFVSGSDHRPVYVEIEI